MPVADAPQPTPKPTPEPTVSFLRHWLAELGEAWWVFLLVPIVLTIFGIDGWASGASLLIGWGVSMTATLCIGATTQAFFVFGERRAIELPLRLHYPLWVLLGVFFGTELTLLGLNLWAEFDVAQMRSGMWLIGGTVAVVLTITGVTYDRLRRHARETELREERARREAVQAQLDALRSRVDPHFLFNALNTVLALIEEDPPAAARAVEGLSDLLRYSVERGPAERVPLSEELAVARAYLELERARFGERLVSRIEVEPPLDARLEEIWVPPLSLQPLVENAVKHGVARSREPVAVEIHAREHEGELRLSVCDDARGPLLPSRGSSTAHQTLRRRLELLYGPRARLETQRGDDDTGYRATLHMPRELHP